MQLRNAFYIQEDLLLRPLMIHACACVASKHCHRCTCHLLHTAFEHILPHLLFVLASRAVARTILPSRPTLIYLQAYGILMYEAQACIANRCL